MPKQAEFTAAAFNLLKVDDMNSPVRSQLVEFQKQS